MCAVWAAVLIGSLAGCAVEETTKKKSKPNDLPGEDDTTNYPASQACTVVPQATCPSTHTCQVVTIAGGTMCESAGTVGFGGYCNINTDCAPGLACAYRQCRPYCETAADCGGPAPTCHQMLTGSDEIIEKFRVCSIPCSPVDPQNGGGAPELAACPNGWACFPFGGDAVGSTECFEAGTAPAGASCESLDDCQPGLVCLSSGAASSCTPLCIVGLSGCSCGTFAEPQYVALASGVYELGYCQ